MEQVKTFNFCTLISEMIVIVKASPFSINMQNQLAQIKKNEPKNAIIETYAIAKQFLHDSPT